MMFCLVFSWGVFGSIAGAIAAVRLDEDLSDDARVVVTIGVSLLFPLLLAIAVLISVSYSLPLTIYRGVRDLRQAFWPAKADLPKARVVK